MASQWITASLVLVVAAGVTTEDLPELPKGCLSGEPSYSAGDLTGAVLGTLIVTLLLLALGYAIYRMYWRGRRGKHLVLVTDAERGATDDYAFDNPCFRDGTPIGRSGYEKEPVKLDQKQNNRWSAWSPLGVLVGNRNEKRRALDDSFAGEPQVSVVSLRSHDFTGLGFNVCGNMRDGIFVKDVLHRGPASESGRITSGDRIDSIRISFRHMVFEDALTILSYASPYEVQLEVENPSPSSRPSTLIRTKRSSIEPADRICHPFYRSQSIADLAQIGKASLKTTQDMGGNLSPKTRIESWDEKRQADYPTLKLSPTPTKETVKPAPAPTKETIKLEKTANPTTPTAAAIVKPERVRKPAPQVGAADEAAAVEAAAVEAGKDGKADSAGKHQRFGIRVLPDPKAILMKNNLHDGKTGSISNKPEIVGNTSKSNPMIGDKSAKTYNVLEAERRENERNSMVEKSNVMPMAKNTVVSGEVNQGKKLKSSLNEDTVDSASKVVRSLTYDERGIDVGPAEEEEENKRKASISSEQAGKVEDGSKKSKEGEGHSNVKLLLTKGLQNLKEKLHHTDKKKVSSSPEPEIEIGSNPSEAKKSAATKNVKVAKSESSDSDGDKRDKKKSKPAKLIQQNGSKEEGKDKTQKEDMKKDGKSKEVNEKERAEREDEGNIPTEMPENVRRAAMAARHNRRSLITDQVPSVGPDVSDAPADGKATPMSGQVDEPPTNPLFPTVKYRQRKEESLSEDSSGDDRASGASGRGDDPGLTPRKSNKRKAPIPPAKDADDAHAATRAQTPDARDVDGNPGKPDNGVKVVQQHEKTTADENIRTMEVHVETDRNVKFADVPKQQNSPSPTNEITNIAVDDGTSAAPSRPTVTAAPAKPTAPSDQLTVTVETANSDSDSDAEPGDAAGKACGTRIELNSSHITIHHSPSSESAAAEAEGSRKAASMGDLSRLDAEQPVLERAVSLDLADGGAPGGKKRKAPPPPPADDRLAAAAVDPDDGGVYRKEPRLDGALDTFQRRRLKKSSNWGTMEDAVQQSPPDSPRKSAATPTNIHVNMFDNEPTSLTISIGDDVDDSEVFLESSPRSHQPMEVDVSPTNVASFPVASVRTFETSKAYLNSGSERDRPTQVSSVSVVGRVDSPDEPSSSAGESVGSQRTVLLIAPEPVGDDAMTQSQVTLTRQPGAGPSSLAPEPVGSHVAMTQSLVTLTRQPGAGPSSLADEPAESSAPDGDLAIGGSRLLGLIRNELRNGTRSIGEADSSAAEPSEAHTIVSSTPIARRDHRRNETVQSSHVTSSENGAQSVNVVSSTARGVAADRSDFDVSNVSSSEESVAEDSNVSVTSTSEAFLTAGSVVDSTNTFVAASDEDSTFDLDAQPPELPTSPVPLLNSLYNPSSSMTYITEIQVTTTAPQKPATAESHNGVADEMVNASAAEPRASPQEHRSGSEDGDSDVPVVVASIANGGYGQPRSNVTVTAIRNAAASPDRSKIPTRVGAEGQATAFHADRSPSRAPDGLLTTFAAEASHIPMRISSSVLTTFAGNRTSPGSPERSQIPMRIVSTSSAETSPIGGNNGVGEKRGKAVRPPVPPRKSDSSAMAFDSPNSGQTAEPVLAAAGSGGHTTYGFGSHAQSSGGAKKYISFSSLPPRAVADRNSSSFEQWVFLDESQSNGKPHNGGEASGDEATHHSSVVTMPISVSSISRPASVTHIVMDSKQSSGKRGSQ